MQPPFSRKGEARRSVKPTLNTPRTEKSIKSISCYGKNGG